MGLRFTMLNRVAPIPLRIVERRGEGLAERSAPRMGSALDATTREPMERSV